MYRCGPASVQAIKHGQICYPFDAPFVFAEVNSDVVFYSRSRDGTLTPVRVNISHVGRKMLTKAAGGRDSRDITDHYKFPEGSEEERTVMEKAEEFGCNRESVVLPEADVVLELPPLEVRVGEDFHLTLQLTNRSEKRRVVNGYVSGTVVYYTGVTSSEFLFKTPRMTLDPMQTEKEVVPVLYKDYQKHLVEQSNLHFIVTGKVKETGQIVTAMRVVALRNPEIIVQVSGLARVSEEMMVLVEFTNPFSFSLEDVYVRMEGPGVMLPKKKHYSLITAGQSITWTERFTPRRAGPTTLIASLDCAALRQVYGQTQLTIQP
ncbi:coagulation factor XIII A chain-like [Hypomesus transpacificus]|uniref:coagulation factor XIII A chain-like n=1 Tax=Hypomesus transpacificus TaxID=137520 RepID=UPI001F078B0B|nr:coagulation factor XIII A chain-like [Hypomesus transpacificus]